MKISDIRCHLMQAAPPPHMVWSARGISVLASSRNWLVVTVYTDAGVVGTACATPSCSACARRVPRTARPGVPTRWAHPLRVTTWAR